MMDIIEYFEQRSDQVLNSQNFDEAKEYLAFYLGAYDLSKTMSLMSTDQELKISEMLNQLCEFVSDNWS